MFAVVYRPLHVVQPPYAVYQVAEMWASNVFCACENKVSCHLLIASFCLQASLTLIITVDCFTWVP